jgi:uncharacterized membrane protein
MFKTYAWDLGIFAQAFWTTVNYGKFFYYTPELLVNPSGSFFGIHFSPIIFLALPIYAIYPTPQTLLILQSLVLALGVVPLYKLSMHILRCRIASLFFVFAYLLYPPLQGINWFDFHTQIFLPLFFLSSMYFLEKQSWKMYFLFIVLSLSCEEHAALIVSFIGFFVALQHRTRFRLIFKNKNFKDIIFLVAVGTVTLAIFWYLIVMWIRDTFFALNPLFLSTFKASANWSVLGAPDPIMIPIYIFLYPQRAIAALGYDFLLKLGYLVILFGPLAFKPLSRIKYLLPTVPWFVYAFFSNYQPYYMIYFQYPAYVIAFIFVAAVHSTSKSSSPGFEIKKLVVMFLCSLITFSVVSPISPIVNMLYPEQGTEPITRHEQFIHTILTYVPPNASIITQSNLFPHVSGRLDAYVIPTIGPIWNSNISECKRFTTEILEKVDYVLVDIKTDSFATRELFDLLKENENFKVLVSADGVVLFKKNYDGAATILAPYNLIYTYSNLTLYVGEVVADLNSTSVNVLHFNGSLGESPIFWYSPRTILPPGIYAVTLRMRIKGIGELFTVDLCSNNGQTILKSRIFSHMDVMSNNVWANYTFCLELEQPFVDFEIRAVNLSVNVDLYLDYIEVKQLA